MPIRLSEDDFAGLVDQALASVAPHFQQYLQNVIVEIQMLPTAKTARPLHLEPDSLLLGVYHGVPLTKKSVESPVDWPGRIILFQRNIESVCHNKDEIVEQVRKTVLHEIGHHFGMDEDDLDRLGYG
jgi:predicted Zn-dependent protease with MMP-like domain